MTYFLRGFFAGGPEDADFFELFDVGRDLFFSTSDLTDAAEFGSLRTGSTAPADREGFESRPVSTSVVMLVLGAESDIPPARVTETGDNYLPLGARVATRVWEGH